MNATSRPPAAEVPALAALFTGALAIGSSGIFVRLSETGPTATAFWRGAIALPFLLVWVLLERRHRAAAGQTTASWRDPLFLWAGVFFTGDLALWHWSLLLTSIAASTLEANCAPLLVTLFAWMLWGERPRLGFVLSLVLAFTGMMLMLAPKLGGGGHGMLGDALGLGTACFYAAYIMVVARLRQRHDTGIVMFASTLVFTVLLLPIALTQKFLPDTTHGWWLLIGCALSAQVVGQSLIAYALAHLPATFSAVGLYAQVIAAAGYAWVLLGERLSPIQLLGGATVMLAIAFARNARRGEIAPQGLADARVQPVKGARPQ